MRYIEEFRSAESKDLFYLGQAVAQFVTTPAGRYFLEKATLELIQARNALEEAEAPADILRYKMNAAVARKIILWIDEIMSLSEEELIISSNSEF